MRQLRSDGRMQPGLHGAQRLKKGAADEVLSLAGPWKPNGKAGNTFKDSLTGRPPPQGVVMRRQTPRVEILQARVGEGAQERGLGQDREGTDIGALGRHE